MFFGLSFVLLELSVILPINFIIIRDGQKCEFIVMFMHLKIKVIFFYR